jgi:hypothetical protein
MTVSNESRIGVIGRGELKHSDTKGTEEELNHGIHEKHGTDKNQKPIFFSCVQCIPSLALLNRFAFLVFQISSPSERRLYIRHLILRMS